MSSGTGLVTLSAFREEAEPGQYGYCGGESINRTAEQTLNFTTNWGFCLRSAACAKRSNGFVKRKRLNSIYLDILTVKQCGQFTENINPVRELCAGKKISPLFRIYLAQDSAPSGESFQEISAEEVRPTIRPTILQKINSTRRSWAIGGGDTCQGDSGGPLIKRLGGVAVLVGVVSRGTRCGRLDSAGIYVREERERGAASVSCQEVSLLHHTSLSPLQGEGNQ